MDASRAAQACAFMNQRRQICSNNNMKNRHSGLSRRSLLAGLSLVLPTFWLGGCRSEPAGSQYSRPFEPLDLSERQWHEIPSIVLAAIAGSLLLAASLAGAANDAEDNLARATFAGGCFWCMEPPYDDLDGVVETISGFSGGHVPNPTYADVVRGGTGHREVVQVVFDPEVVDYAELLHVFWRNVDPFDDGGQFCDRGDAYRTAIFTHSDEQMNQARASLEKLEASGRFEQTIVTPILDFENFYAAEEYHQGYYRENPVRYKFYRWRCGRDARLEEIWGDEAGG
jgi:peptide-methionine (S)-S-oxide reductase